ncbi:MAG: hypothetical protein GF331_00830 [Chitinivibrionales bacterium]|nr:hypothetical protein [Chitinivibrionales bacterium]
MNSTTMGRHLGRPLWLCALTAAALACTAAGQVCEFSIKTCPENLDGDTIVLSDNTVALSASIMACEPTEVIEKAVDSTKPPSIFFIIDHSHSMSGLGRTYPGNDPYGSRFDVVRDLLDTIYTAYPNAEVGAVVFREVLYFDHSNNNLFVPLVGQGDQSLLPLLRLDDRLPGNTPALSAIQSVLRTDTVIGYNPTHQVNVEYVDLVYKPVFTTIGNTNINNAFEAAKQAFALSDNPPERQFIVFLSDGEPFPTNTLHGGRDPFYFAEGNNTPTTFTVYFTKDATAPQSLITMTENIRSNGYSTSNPLSDLWTVETNYDTLMALLRSHVLRPILTVTTGEPTALTVNGERSTTYTDSSFVFSGRFPLQDGATDFSLAIDYQLRNLHTGETSDTTYQVNFVVVRQPGAMPPDGISVQCWEEGVLELRHRGVAVSTVNETMDTLEVVFNPVGVHYDSVTLTITHVVGGTLDVEHLRLTYSSGVWVGTFVRRIDGPAPGDGVLQHEVFDSIVAVYRNPSLPLDTVRLPVPFAVTQSVILQRATYFDRDADGYVDSIFMVVDGDLRQEELQTFMGHITLPAQRGFTVMGDSTALVSGGVSLVVRESRSHEPATAILTGDTIGVSGGRLTHSGWIMPTSVTASDKVAPVIVSAHLKAHESSVDPDTLTVRFSEPVITITSTGPFLFYGTQTGQPYDAEVDIALAYQQADTLVVPVAGVANDDNAIVAGDSIWIQPIAQIADGNGNRQSNPSNRRVVVTTTVVRDPYSLDISVANNPVTLGDKRSRIPPFLLELEPIRAELEGSRYQGSGIVVIAEASNPDKLGPNFTLTGEISVFDIVNNPVIVERPMAFDDGDGRRTKRLYYVWDGRNRNGRYVGTGTYLAVMTIEDDQGYKETKTVRLGVKR